jgi:CheY-like chemotaxis protein
VDTRGTPITPDEEPATSLLVVDDDPFIARLLKTELTAAGFELTRRLRVVERAAAAKAILLSARGSRPTGSRASPWERTTTS